MTRENNLQDAFKNNILAYLVSIFDRAEFHLI